jgi:hypothetical protein
MVDKKLQIFIHKLAKKITKKILLRLNNLPKRLTKERLAGSGLDLGLIAELREFEQYIGLDSIVQVVEVETLVDGDAELFVLFLLLLIIVLVCVDDFDFAGEG